MNAECCANEWCQCESPEAEVICLALVQERQGWELAKPTSIYSNPTHNGGIPFKYKIYWPTNSLASVCGLPTKVPFELFSEHHMYPGSGGAHSQRCAGGKEDFIAEVSW